MNPDTPIEEVWAWLCEHIPGLAESPGIGIVPEKANVLTYCEARLTGLIARALGMDIYEVWFTEGLGYEANGNVYARVIVTAGYGSVSQESRGEVECEWGDPTRFPTKEARLRAVVMLLDKMRPQLEAEALAKADQARAGIFIEGTPLRRIRP